MIDDIYFESKIKELVNCLSGRICVHINDILGNYIDIKVPEKKSFDKRESINFDNSEVLVFKIDFQMDEKKINTFLYIYKNSLESLYDSPEDFFLEVFDDFVFLFSEIVGIFNEKGEVKIIKSFYKNDFLCSVFNDEIGEKLNNRDKVEYFRNHIINIKEKSDFGGLYMFF